MRLPPCMTTTTWLRRGESSWRREAALISGTVPANVHRPHEQVIS
jgi:hypothetical protein